MKRLLLFVLLLTTGIAYSQAPTYPSSFTVAQDGSGNFKTIQEAIYAVRDLSQQQVTIFIKNGTYREKLVIPSWKTNITLKGESRDSTIITYDDHAGKRLAVRDEFLKQDSIRTYTSYTVLIEGNDCRLENLTVRNTAGRVGQAVALHVEGDRFSAFNCKLLGNQDTLYAATQNSRQYYENCFIEGTTDFIFGEATVVFVNCDIKSLTNSYITAASTRPGQLYGFVFIQCRLIADPAVTKVYLGRPWRPYSKTVYIETYMDKHIVKEGWNNWGNVANEQTVLYAEYNSSGAGANKEGRVKWAKQLSAKERKKYTAANILKGSDNWKPAQ
ncbi:MAG TPA: pectinesterase family protein [Chitinophagaceae bacterium]|nr:pectinesterase family protein [Chitinophagaceae bacterium]